MSKVKNPLAGRKIAKVGGKLSGGGTAARTSRLPGAGLPAAGKQHPSNSIGADVYRRASKRGMT